RGAPLPGGTHLRLVVADNPPFVLDVDADRVTPVAGIRRLARGTWSVVGVDGRAAVVVDARADIYAGSGSAARALGTGTAVAAADGRSVWVESRAQRSRCTLWQVGLAGQTIRPPRAIRCAATISPAGSLGLVVNRVRVIDPGSGRTL